MLTTDIENYPGLRRGSGRPRADGEHAEPGGPIRGGVPDVQGATGSTSPPAPSGCGRSDPSTGEEVEYQSRAVIVSTGARSLMLGLPAEQRLLSRGVSTCATCDGFFFRGKHIAVIGGGDSALEEAIFLTKFGETVTVVHRRKELRASKIMQDRAFKNPKISFVWDSVVDDIDGDHKVKGLHLRNLVTGEDSYLPVDGVFVAIGHAPNTDIFAGQLDMDEAGYLLTQPGFHRYQHPRRLRLRRRPGPHLPPGGHRRRHRLYGGHRRRAVARGRR